MKTILSLLISAALFAAMETHASTNAPVMTVERGKTLTEAGTRVDFVYYALPSQLDGSMPFKIRIIPFPGHRVLAIKAMGGREPSATNVTQGFGPFRQQRAFSAEFVPPRGVTFTHVSAMVERLMPDIEGQTAFDLRFSGVTPPIYVSDPPEIAKLELSENRTDIKKTALPNETKQKKTVKALSPRQTEMPKRKF